mgnify:CR=1 FL=1
MLDQLFDRNGLAKFKHINEKEKQYKVKFDVLLFRYPYYIASRYHTGMI